MFSYGKFRRSLVPSNILISTIVLTFFDIWIRRIRKMIFFIFHITHYNLL